MKFNKKYGLAAIIFIILGSSIGAFWGGFILGNNIFKDNNSSVKITSIENNEEVHSVVVIDASTTNADSVEVLINNKTFANYVPYYWNNMLEPAGTYNITVKITRNGVVSEDTKSVIIPKTLRIGKNYDFTEHFVVHKNQTVIFEDGYWKIADDEYSNGLTNINEITMFSVNVFGQLDIINSTIECKTFCGEENSVTTLNNSHIIVTKRYNQDIPDEGLTVISANAIRFDDKALLKHTNILVQAEGNYLYYDPTVEMDYFFIENARQETI